jgi:EAL and modified HD-GYP domain-containing signal transduction protein
MFSLADGSPGSAWLTQVDLFDYVRVDARALPTEHLGRYLSALKRRGPQLIATGLTSREDQRRAQDAGADLFEGYWFERPETGASQGVAPIYGAVMRTLALVRAEAPFREIEQTVRADATLAFRLLRFVNSAAFALPAEIGSIADAIALLGYRQIGRWLGLSLVTAKVDAGAHAPLASTAISRGRLMELLSQSGVDGVDPGDAFMVGLFSMLDALLDMPMERVVQTLSPPPAVARALLERTGPLGQLLGLIEACEDPSRVRIAELAQALRLEAATLARLRVQALDWAERQLH